MSEKPTFYITTPIYYPSDNLHIGHAYTTVAADAFARFKRLTGYDVRFLTGSDEHGQKIERRAKKAGETPIEFVDKIVASFQNLWQHLDISYDDFIRTTEPRHEKVVQDIFTRLYEQDDIYKAEYEGWYCTPCETFWTEHQIAEHDHTCPDCGRPVELVKEESYFFKMSKYADRMLKHIEDNPDFIQPASRRNEMISFIKSGLEDLCVSRTSFSWGIKVPFDPKHVVYVWVDALTNYISALGYGSEDDSLFRRYWPCDVHLVGKDIVRFHTVIWPIMLMACGIELPQKVMGHGWLLLNGGKMSKSKGNVVDPLVLIDKYGVDAIRYYLLRELPFGSDGYYAEEILVNRINSDLANDLGNLVNRSINMIKKYFGGTLQRADVNEAVDEDLKAMVLQTPHEVETAMDKLEISTALAEIWKLVSRTNKYIDETMPWSLAKDPAKADRLQTVMYNLMETIRCITVMVSPFMTRFPAKVWPQIGIAYQPELYTWESIQQWGGMPDRVTVQTGEILFPRIDPKSLDIPQQAEENPSEDNKEDQTQKAEENYITIDDFAKIDLRVAKVIAAEKVPKADKLLKLQLELGGSTRTVVSGIAKQYTPEDIIGQKVIVVANLKPAKLRGIMSEGMILAASSDDNSDLEVLTLVKDLPTGSRVS